MRLGSAGSTCGDEIDPDDDVENGKGTKHQHRYQWPAAGDPLAISRSDQDSIGYREEKIEWPNITGPKHESFAVGCTAVQGDF